MPEDFPESAQLSQLKTSITSVILQLSIVSTRQLILVVHKRGWSERIVACQIVGMRKEVNVK
jgi:hypothetical protein